MATPVPVTLDTLITIKISIQGSNRKFKVPMRDLGAHVLPHKLRLLLSIPPNQEVVFERFSDSAGAYITLDADSPTVYKTLFRAAKAKLKLRLKATIVDNQNTQQATRQDPARHSSMSAVTSNPLPALSLPYRTCPSAIEARTVGFSEGAPSTTGTIPLYPYARLPAFHSTNMRTMTKPAEPVPTKPIQIADGEDEAPVPSAFTMQKIKSPQKVLPFRNEESPAEAPPHCAWSVYCNTCDKPMADEHYHCSVCDDGDYDLCGACVEAGHHCPGVGHWLIKRFVRSGTVINSTTERVGPKIKSEISKETPGSFTEEKRIESESFELPTRTCNSCIRDLPETEFVTCKDCDDYDLCIPCILGSKHGHHPGHAFEPVSEKTELGPLTGSLIRPGRNVRHHAICDGCNTNIYGIRFMCTDCPDWDYCSQCVDSAKSSHPKHRFVPVYDSLIGSPSYHACRHFGIYCDGLMCRDKMNQSYIEGVRYKCVVCHNTDFCATCEAHPSNRHNRTHPMIVFKTPVNYVSVTTTGEDKHGAPMESMGDQPSRKSASTETISVAPSNAATEVQTIADLKPSDEANTKPVKEKIQIKDLLAEPILDIAKAEETIKPKVQFDSLELNAHFIRDTISDGTKVKANERFVQSWTLRNPGPHAWPAGCSVRYTGGDDMLALNATHPSIAAQLAEATESNVLGREISVGEEVCFTVVMKAPSKEGPSISYWRLTAANGMPFGHRLWCHVEVLLRSIHSPAVNDGLPTEAMTVLEQQNKKRSLLSKQQMNSIAAPQHTPSSTTECYEAQLEMLEAANKKRRVMALQAGEQGEKKSPMLRMPPNASNESQESERDDVKTQSGGPIVSQLGDFQLLLMSLEQENKRRLFRARQEQALIEQGLPAARINELMLQQAGPSNATTAANADNTGAGRTEFSGSEGFSSEESRMIFPVLEKESPMSSTHEAVGTDPIVTSGTIPRTETVVSATSDGETLETFEDIVSVDLDSSSEDNGFLTDEEYDILDASDTELTA